MTRLDAAKEKLVSFENGPDTMSSKRNELMNKIEEFETKRKEKADILQQAENELREVDYALKSEEAKLSDLREARAMACDMAKSAAQRQRLRLSMSELATIGRLALDYVVNKTCPRCHGTKFERIEGSNCLGTKPCIACGGDGRRTVPKRYRKLIIEVVARIERIEGTLDTIVAHRV